MPQDIVFNPGFSSGSKRKRMPGTDPHGKIEIKTASMMTVTNNISDKFDVFVFKNQYSYGFNIDTGIAGSWIPIPVREPLIGANSFQRVGSAYFIKYFRLKGFVETHGNCVNPIHWRLRLLRIADEVPFSLEDTQIDRVNNYLKFVYKNPYLISSSDTASTIFEKFVRNYYCCIKNLNTNSNLKSKVIASGYIPSNVLPMRQGTLTIGSSSTLSSSLIISDLKTSPYGYNKFDVRVVINDSIKYSYETASESLAANVASARYWVVMETDCPFGLSISNPSAGGQGVEPSVGSYSYSTTSTDSNFELKFTQIQYFIDP